MYGVKYEIDEMMSASQFSRNMNKVAELLRVVHYFLFELFVVFSFG